MGSLCIDENQEKRKKIFLFQYFKAERPERAGQVVPYGLVIDAQFLGDLFIAEAIDIPELEDLFSPGRQLFNLVVDLLQQFCIDISCGKLFPRIIVGGHFRFVPADYTLVLKQVERGIFSSASEPGGSFRNGSELLAGWKNSIVVIPL